MFKKDKLIKKLADTKLFMDAAVNTDVPIEDIFEALDVHKKELIRENIKGQLVGGACVLAGSLIGLAIVKRYF